jgi:GntR family transcriptional regulator
MLDHDSPVPLHEQLAIVLRAKIESAELTGRVPSIISIAQEYRTGHNTAARALATLRDEGLITSARGRGYYVTRNRSGDS